MVSIDDVKKIEVRVGTVVTAERIPDTDKLLRLTVDVGEETPRQIVSGIALYTTPEDVVGKQYTFITNLEPRTIRGFESNGMLFAAHNEEEFAFLTPSRPVKPGTPAG